MQLMTLNSLLMFDIVFIFFLFLVGVTCLVYYLPPPALNSIRSGSKSGSYTGSSSGTTTTCTGETVRFRRYSVGSLLSASEVAVGNHRFHSPSTVFGEQDLTVGTAVVECPGVLEEILSLSGSPRSIPPPICACCALEQHRNQHQHLIENPHDPTPPVSGGALAGVDYVQIEIERTATDPAPPCCYVRAKDADVKQCHGPIHDV